MSLRDRRRGGAQERGLVFYTNVPVDDQFSCKQIRYASAGLLAGKLLVMNYSAIRAIAVRNPNLSYFSKYANDSGKYWEGMVDADALNMFTARVHASVGCMYKVDIATYTTIASSSAGTVNSARMLDAAHDDDYVYVSSNNTTNGHGFIQIKKSDMSVTASALATGAGDGQFNNPMGIFYYNSEIYVADYDNSRISVWVKSGETLTYDRKYDLGFKPMDICFDETNWYVQGASKTYKYDNVFTEATKVSVDCVGYSITYVPDQSDGNGATIAISNNTNSCLYRRKCSDLSLIATTGSSGDSSTSIFDPVITGVAGVWTIEGNIFSVESGVNISWHGFTGYSFGKTGTNKAVFIPAADNYAGITDINAANDLVARIVNVTKCASATITL